MRCGTLLVVDNEQGAQEWRAAWGRVWDLVDREGVEADRRVPACPDWTVRELVAHMVGLVVDVLADDEDPAHAAWWTARQVEQRQDRTVAELRAEWEAHADDLVAWVHDHHTRPLGDVVIHEQDLREALGEPGGGDSAGFRALRDRMAGELAEAVADQPPLALLSPTWRWASAGDPDDPGSAATVLEAGELDLTRAVMSRRSEAQLRSWTTRGDVGPYLHGFRALGELPEVDAG